MIKHKMQLRALWNGDPYDPVDVDTKAVVDDYTLRVEQMDNRSFWWSVSHKKEGPIDEHIEIHDEETVDLAIDRCFNIMMEHYKKNNVP